MTIKVYKTSDDYYKVTKTLTLVSTLSNVSIVYPCNIENPTLKIKGGYINANYLDGLFGRKYHIDNQTINDGINYLSCTVDVWGSFPESIYGTTQFVTRSEKYGNPYISDSTYPSTSDTVIDVYPTTSPQTLISNLTYVIGVI